MCIWLSALTSFWCTKPRFDAREVVGKVTLWQGFLCILGYYHSIYLEALDWNRPCRTLVKTASLFFLCWRYNPLWVLAFSAIFLHSILSLLSFLHPLIPIIWISSSSSSNHLFHGCPLILLPIGFHPNILLGILPPSICITCPSQAILLLFKNLTMSAFSMSSFNSWFFLILQIPFLSCTGPKIFLNKMASLQFDIWTWYLPDTQVQCFVLQLLVIRRNSTGTRCTILT